MCNNKKIKIVHVAECIGGVDKYLHSLIKYMDHDKFNNVVILSQLYKKEEYEGLADFVEKVNMIHGMRFETIISAKDIRKIIKKHDPDVVYAHSSIAGVVTRLACIGLKCKVIYNPHGWSFNMQSKKQNVFIWLERLMAYFCDAIICISEAEKKSAIDKKICKENKLHIIYNGIEINRKPEKTRTELGIPEDIYIVGMVGRICKQKAPDTFIKMAKYLRDVYLVIVGDILEGSNEERKEIEDLAIKYGVQLKITGWVNNPLDYIGVFDVACLLSRWEGFGLVLPEYMLCGKPIVATNVDAIPYIIENGKNGLLVDIDDSKGAAEAVLKIRNNKELQEKLVNNGKKEVLTKYDVRRVSKETENFLNKLLNNFNAYYYKGGIL